MLVFGSVGFCKLSKELGGVPGGVFQKKNTIRPDFFQTDRKLASFPLQLFCRVKLEGKWPKIHGAIEGYNSYKWPKIQMGN